MEKWNNYQNTGVKIIKLEIWKLKTYSNMECSNKRGKPGKISALASFGDKQDPRFLTIHYSGTTAYAIRME